ncbi:MAG: FtsX-like permease family protein [Vicinamibacterales bacterium]|nr:hypothetical protein [Acidobacteriota bacterium]MDP6371009.1 FtsX-like permease family protein [Vicinamibacterales bacterium]MDP6609163.1 FtsX-like permease family protein [Vicinamibacterales bacterium]HAK57128.1 hypothetical protein [Acidobacteriota bacterium]
MSRTWFVLRSLIHYRGVNLTVVAGVGVAVAVLAGALLVGGSVRGSLRDLALGRLGLTDTVVTAPVFFRDALAADLLATPAVADGFDGAVPLIALNGFVTDPASGRRATGVQVYGVDARFWAFHQRAVQTPGRNGLLLGEALARELAVEPGTALLLRVERPTDVPLGSLHGRRDDVGRTVRLTVAATLAPAALGEFSLRQQQGSVRAVFVELSRLQETLELDGQVNTVLLSSAADPLNDDAGAAGVEAVESALRAVATLDDLALTVRALPEREALVVESGSGMVGDVVAEAVREAAEPLGLEPQPVLTYLINRLRLGPRETPYSLVTGVDFPAFSALSSRAQRRSGLWPEALEYPPILLNEWAAQDLGARQGDIIEAEYYIWEDAGRLVTRETEFQLYGVLPIDGPAADPDLAPAYEGITDAETIVDWDPPFPIDLGAIGPRDEEYWDRHRTTPKGFIELGAGQTLWQSRYGQLTSVRLLNNADVDADAVPDLESREAAFRTALAARLDPIAAGIGVTPVRALALGASVGATDFGEYFTYFSFFIVVSALLLASLFFRLGVEQRVREVGALQAFGFSLPAIRGLFWREAIVLGVIGGLIGTAGAIGYARLIMYGLRTWWVDAVGTTLLTLHLSAATLWIGASAGVLAAVATITLSLRALRSASPRRLLTGALPEIAPDAGERSRTVRVHLPGWLWPPVLAAGGLGLVAAARAGALNATAGFFGAGLLLLASLLGTTWLWLRRGSPGSIAEAKLWPVVQLGLRNSSYRPGRSVLCIALIAFAAFIIVAVDAFRRGEGDPTDRTGGTGGYALLADSLLPLGDDLSEAEGLERAGVTGAGAGVDILESTAIERFRVRAGDDASCLNLYRPGDPRVVGVSDRFIRQNRFSFGATLAETPDELENPWRLLRRQLPNGVVPALADANSLTYAMHLAVGDEIVLNRGSDREVTLRIVAALTDSVLQRELIVSETHFRRVFPEEEGYRFFLVDVGEERAAEAAALLEDRLADFGFDVAPTAERLAAFHRIENTYLATFQTLGALGLLLGTFGLGAVLLRNVLERRRELALLRAVGYERRHLAGMVLAENLLLLTLGLGIGAACALVAIAPAWLERGQRLPFASIGWLLVTVALAGVLASLAATRVMASSPLLPALKTE